MVRRHTLFPFRSPEVTVIRVLLVEDTQSMRGSLASLLNRERDITIVAVLDVESLLVHRQGRLGPDVIVINTEYMVSQILPIIDALKTTDPTCAVLILADPNKRGMLPPRKRSRALNFVVKGLPAPLLAQAIREVHSGERIIDPRLEIAAITTDKTVSTREWEVLGLAAQGETVADIARRLYLSLGTVRNHLSAVIAKTGARNRIDAIRIARKDGWLK